MVNWTADVENNQLGRYQVTMYMAFKVEHHSSTSQGTDSDCSLSFCLG
ncbi:MAG: hypothetical protein ACFB4I_08365 [Cyanophyceae cyanobacterium]